jgi:2,4-dienoyl-CoA reductase (NADPH2)
VVLFEGQHRLGGALVLASVVHADNERFLAWLLAEVRRLPVDIRLGKPVACEDVLAEQPDEVIVATGARVATPQISGLEQSHVLTGALMRQVMAGDLSSAEAWRLPAWQRWLVSNLMPLVQRVLTPGLLRRVSHWWMPLGRQVVIVGADLAAVELAEFLAGRGRRVHLLESGRKIIPEVGKKRRNEHMDRLDRLHVTVNTQVEVVRIEPRAVLIKAADIERRLAADSIIVAGSPEAEKSLAQGLAARGVRAQAIGDCSRPGLIVGAINAAADAVAAIDDRD